MTTQETRDEITLRDRTERASAHHPLLLSTLLRRLGHAYWAVEFTYADGSIRTMKRAEHAVPALA